MKGWSKTVNRGTSGARKTQRASGDHSTRKTKQKAGPAAKESSMAYGKLQAERPGRDNINGPMKG